MPNTFAPRAFERVVKDRVEVLRMEYDTSVEGQERGDIKEWHAIIDLLGPEATEDFVSQYARIEEIPDVIDLGGE